jgi:Zn-dependent protease with chaperone function
VNPSDARKAVAANNPSLAYRAGLALVVLGMAILPLIYIALTVLACWWVYFFATEYFLSIWGWRVPHVIYGNLLKVVCSGTPLLVGVAIAIAMVKPLFARRGAHMQPLALQPEIEPRVYELVQQVCEQVGAPAPRRVELNCELNASAGFDRGMGGFFGNQLILTLGMPLLAGLTKRELAGVIAHEFGHFRQGAGMRLSYLIRRVNGWFARVVYERDGWDEALESAAETEEGWIQFMVGCARAGVGLSRGVLWLLMMTGHGISGFLLRQMEYDADRWEVRIAGSAGFESTMLRLSALGYVLGDIHREMRRSWRRDLQLPDNLPLLVEYRATHLPAEKRATIENKAGLEKTGWFDTHPSTADRVRRARQLGEAGIFINDSPARELFENFETLSRLVTLAHYEDDLNVPTSPDFLIPLEHVIQGVTTPAPAPAPAPLPMPMMSYDPSRFRPPEQRPPAEP